MILQGFVNATWRYLADRGGSGGVFGHSIRPSRVGFLQVVTTNLEED